MKKKIEIEGMTCNHCVAHVKEALGELGGKHIKVSLKEGCATLDTDQPDGAISAAIVEAGYEVKGITAL